MNIKNHSCLGHRHHGVRNRTKELSQPVVNSRLPGEYTDKNSSQQPLVFTGKKHDKCRTICKKRFILPIGQRQLDTLRAVSGGGVFSRGKPVQAAVEEKEVTSEIESSQCYRCVKESRATVVTSATGHT